MPFFGQMAIDRISGFLDEHTGAVVANSFQTGHLNLETAEDRWRGVDSKKNLPVASAVTLRTLECWPEELPFADKSAKQSRIRLNALPLSEFRPSIIQSPHSAPARKL